MCGAPNSDSLLCAENRLEKTPLASAREASFRAGFVPPSPLAELEPLLSYI